MIRFALLVLAIAALSAWLTWGTDVGHDLYCFGKIDSITWGC